MLAGLAILREPAIPRTRESANPPSRHPANPRVRHPAIPRSLYLPFYVDIGLIRACFATMRKVRAVRLEKETR